MKYYSVVTFEVKDYEQFRKEFESMQDKIHSVGFKRTWLNRNVDNSTQLIVVHECESIDKARRFYQSSDFKDCTLKAGVIGTPNITFIEELLYVPELATATTT
jgi:uncharacterized protein (DUF1330 family)